MESKNKNSLSSKNKNIISYLNIPAKKESKLLKFSLIVPIYNNGEIFLNKCFKSLKEMKNFEDIEIIIVDDGSSDSKTLTILQDIDKKYENIKLCLSDQGNSGSPSTPRNRGLDLCSCNYITYLDPDNESIKDGYQRLYETISNGNYDLVIGNILVKKDNVKKIRNYYSEFVKVNKSDESNDGKDILIKTKFAVQSIQATMLKKELIIENNIKMVDKALGEDTLFFYELMLHSKNTKVINDLIHIYDKDEVKSLTNNINEEFFKKYFILEQYKINILKGHNILNEYLDLKYKDYFKAWYLEKLKDVNVEEKENCKMILRSIYNIYKNDWNIKDEGLNNLLRSDNKFKISLIVAVYNNGDFLKNRCIESLSHSSIFDEMEIILVDDGSNDQHTINIIKDLEERYKNIKTYFFSEGGSGSASRPRNKGLELSTTDYITYLDPDNEASNDGYRVLYDNIKDSDLDLVIGNIEFINDTSTSINDYYTVFFNGNNSDISDDSKVVLYNTEFMAQSIQASLIRKSVLIENDLEMINGAIGEDTLFFYQLVNYSKKIKVVKDVIHNYYTNTEGSTTNKIDSNYFKKHLLVEKPKRLFLETNDLINGFLKYKQTYNFRAWIFDKLKFVKAEECLESEKIIDEIYNIYEDVWIIDDNVLLNHFKKRDVYLNKSKKLSILISINEVYVDKLENKIKGLLTWSMLDDVQIIFIHSKTNNKNIIENIQCICKSYNNFNLTFTQKEETNWSELIKTNYIIYLNLENKMEPNDIYKLYQDIVGTHRKIILSNELYEKQLNKINPFNSLYIMNKNFFLNNYLNIIENNDKYKKVFFNEIITNKKYDEKLCKYK